MTTEEHNRLYWQCRRGMLELDLMLIPFLEKAYSDLSKEDQALFEEFLTATDPELYSWLTGNGQSENPAFAAMAKRIHDYVQTSHG